jgi:hypothetical protein
MAAPVPEIMDGSLYVMNYVCNEEHHYLVDLLYSRHYKNATVLITEEKRNIYTIVAVNRKGNLSFWKRKLRSKGDNKADFKKCTGFDCLKIGFDMEFVVVTATVLWVP